MFQSRGNTFSDVPRCFEMLIIVRPSFDRCSTMNKKGQGACILNNFPCIIRYEKSCRTWYDNENQIMIVPKQDTEKGKELKSLEIACVKPGTSERSEQWGIRSSPHNEWGFSNKMLDLTRHIDSVRKA